MPIAADYPFMDIVWTMVLFFLWLLWIWVLVVVLSDVFRSDMGGWGKAGWVTLTIFLPLVGVLLYLAFHGKDMGERRVADVNRAMRSYNGGGAGESKASQIAQAKALLDSGAISQAEYDKLKHSVLL